MGSDGETLGTEVRLVTPPVEVVVLDMGGVACEFVPDRRLRALVELSGRRPEAVDDALFGSGLEDRAERGELTLDEAYEAVEAELGPGLGRDAVRAAWARAFVPDGELLALVRTARRPTALFTNNGPLIEDCLTHELSAVTTAFDRLLVSWRLGVTKPHPEAYAKATMALGVEAEAVLFVDDSPASVAAARASGWNAHPYRGTGCLAELFESHGLLST
jgi:putative hydrolase of the HAD superfamily